MQVNKIQNNNYNKNFTAQLIIEGKTKDIPQKLISSWEDKTKLIGKKSDTLKIVFFDPLDYSQEFNTKTYKVYKDPNYISRTIVAFYDNGSKTLPIPVSYKEPKGGKTHKELLEENMNNFLESLKEKFTK